MVIVAAVIGAVVAGAVWWKRQSNGTSEEAAASAPAESAPAAADGSHRFAKFIEISGFRITEEKQRPVIKMSVTNHSTGDLGSVDLSVSLRATDGKDLGTVELKNVTLGPLESAEVSAPFKTKLRAYELPDWQFIRAEFRITSQ